MTRWLGVALLPRADHLRAAVRLQQDIGGEVPLRPRLAPDGNLPHVTVFQGPFADSLDPAEALGSIATAVAGSGLRGEVSLATTDVIHQPVGWLFLSLERPPLLEALQEAALTVLERHLDRASFRRARDTSRFSDEERASYERYGYRYTGTAYAPHVTLGRAAEHTVLELARTARDRAGLPKELVFDRLSFYVMGEQGAHAKTLLERRF
ncbi:2'-5' RNA ligase family protein [Streptomyces zingiberis]|uniref:2'-5' RNA ligase family protein n=1 Tax=Streptomyces zingiberis TaxID=2053010 RepID=A0ABX1BTZ2_9ACTN|nr:2'-5' RNA ligase family protein [Streptomyces zingiberis]NJQ01161.1 2'-5' RNA ligase family protein [Streptomyces zingiberis]